MTEEEKSSIKKTLENGEPCLYLGAGFSYGAERDGETIPMGDTIKDIVFNEVKKNDDELAEEIKNNDLKDICQALKEIDEEKYIKTIITALNGFKPKDFHYYITDYKWKSIFTVNIDDIVEQVYRYKNIPLQVINAKTITERISEKKQQLYKLHGSITNPKEGIVFSTDEYNDFITDQQNFKLKRLTIDFESSDFFVIGTELNEMEFDFFKSYYKKNQNPLMPFDVYFINPKPSVVFKRSLSKNPNFKLLQISTEEFLNYLHSESKGLQNVIFQQNSIFKRNNFRSYEMILNDYYDRDKKNTFISKLYFGNEPDWEDLTYDFIINYSAIKKFYDHICNKNQKINIFYGALYSGKTSCLKLIFQLLSKKEDCFCLYNIDDSLSIESIKVCIKEIPNSFSTIFLFFDDIGEYYSEFVKILKIDSRIKIVGTTTTIIHNRKKYALDSSILLDYEVPDTLDQTDIEDIQDKLNEKGLSGDFAQLDFIEWCRRINSREGIVSAIYTVTKGTSFRDHYDQIVKENMITQNKFYNLLLVCSFCYLMDIPYVKQHMLSRLNYHFDLSDLHELGDYIKNNNGSIRIRTKFIAEAILSTCSDTELIKKLIIDICISLSSLVTERGRDYFKNAYEYLTKYKNLHYVLHLNNKVILSLYTELQEYYKDKSYYWLQLGIVEQKIGHYDYALQHFKTANSINKVSYGIMHAIARNYCKQALTIDSRFVAEQTFNHGKELFIELIKNREYTLSKAYSVHSLIYEIMEFHKKYGSKISDEEKRLCFELLNNKKLVDPNDFVIYDLKARFLKFLSDSESFIDDDYEKYEENLDL